MKALKMQKCEIGENTKNLKFVKNKNVETDKTLKCENGKNANM